MLTVVKDIKNQLKVTCISIKYALMREMINKASFLMNIIFMILNNSCFIIQWIVIYSLKSEIGGYSFKQILLLWGISASTYGFAHFFFKKSFSLSDTITNGKLDSFLVQPKNVLISAITSEVEVSAIGDMIYGYILLFLSDINIFKFVLFTLFTICGGIVITDFAVIFASLSFWIGKSDTVADTANDLITNFSTYPDGIFKGLSKILLYTIIPVGITTYIPVKMLTEFKISLTAIVIVMSIILTLLTFGIFYKGLKKYSSSNLMISKI